MPQIASVGTIYQNGRYRILPLVTLLILEVDGRRLDTFDSAEIEAAVTEVDRLAAAEGNLAHCSM
jgi:hypothetical protein